MSSSTAIPPFYRIFFSTIDPLIALSGILTQLFSPATILRVYNSTSPTIPPAIETRVLLDSSAGYLLSTLFLQVVMLRLQPTNRTVWRCLEASILIQDVAIVAAVARSLDAQHRLAWGMVTGEEWGNLGILVGVGVVRAAFLMGIGMKGSGEAKNLKRA